MRNCLLSISLWLLLGLTATAQTTFLQDSDKTAFSQGPAQTTFPQGEGDRARFSATVEMSRGYLSGVCVLLREGDEVRGCLFNEFGISAIDFTYSVRKDKVRLHSVIAMLDRWYIRRVLKKDLRELMHRLQQGETTYRDERYKIDYRFTPLAEAPDDEETPFLEPTGEPQTQQPQTDETDE